MTNDEARDGASRAESIGGAVAPSTPARAASARMPSSGADGPTSPSATAVPSASVAPTLERPSKPVPPLPPVRKSSLLTRRLSAASSTSSVSSGAASTRSVPAQPSLHLYGSIWSLRDRSVTSNQSGKAGGRQLPRKSLSVNNLVDTGKSHVAGHVNIGNSHVIGVDTSRGHVIELENGKSHVIGVDIGKNHVGGHVHVTDNSGGQHVTGHVAGGLKKQIAVMRSEKLVFSRQQLTPELLFLVRSHARSMSQIAALTRRIEALESRLTEATSDGKKAKTKCDSKTSKNGDGDLEVTRIQVSFGEKSAKHVANHVATHVTHVSSGSDDSGGEFSPKPTSSSGDESSANLVQKVANSSVRIESKSKPTSSATVRSDNPLLTSFQPKKSSFFLFDEKSCGGATLGKNSGQFNQKLNQNSGQKLNQNLDQKSGQKSNQNSGQKSVQNSGQKPPLDDFFLDSLEPSSNFATVPRFDSSNPVNQT